MKIKATELRLRQDASRYRYDERGRPGFSLAHPVKIEVHPQVVDGVLITWSDGETAGYGPTDEFLIADPLLKQGNYRREFIITQEGWYADAARDRWEPRTVDELILRVALYDDEGHYNGTGGEWKLLWHDLGGAGPALRLHAFQDAWGPLLASGFDQFLNDHAVSWPKDPTPTREQIVEALTELDWADATERVQVTS